MKPFLTIGFFFIAAAAPFAQDAGSKTTNVSVQDLTGLQLSGYAKNDLLQWTIGAEAAELAPESKDVKNPTKNGVWNVSNLRLAFFSDGVKSVEMDSPKARFSPAEKTAVSDETVFVKGDFFSVRGNGWQWENGEKANRVSVKKDVVVTLVRKPETSAAETPKKDEPQKAVVTSKTLTIVNDEAGTTMTFSGEVTVLYGDVFLSADSLEILLPFGKAEGTDFDSRASGMKGLGAVSSICGRGNAVLRMKGYRAAGDDVEFVPADDAVFVRGNAVFEDIPGEITVRGQNGRGNVKTKHFELEGKDAGDTIEIEMPTMAMKQKKGVPVNPMERARLTGTRLVIDAGETETRLTVEGNVRANDGEWTISTDKIVSDVGRKEDGESASSSAGTFQKADLSAVKSLAARGNVEISNETQILTCGDAELFPRQKRVLLTGTPSVKSLKEGADLTGGRAEIFYEEERILVSGDEAGTQKRVAATLPAMSDLQSKKEKTSGGKMTATGDEIEVTRNGELVVFDISGKIEVEDPEFSATADRVVVFALDKKVVDVPEKTPLPQIRRVDVLGNVDIKNAGGRATGGLAVVENGVEVTEWLESDEGGDGARPVRLVVEADPAFPQTSRPRFFMTGEKTEKNVEGYIEGDHLEVLLGESRVRFWLRNDIRLATEAAKGKCNSVEGICLPQPPDNRLGVERIVCRGNVGFERETSVATGSLLELFPRQNLAVLSGTPQMIDERGLLVTPGDDKFVFDTRTRELTTSAAAEEKVGLGKKTTQVSRPKIKISGGSGLNFKIPAKK